MHMKAPNSRKARHRPNAGLTMSEHSADLGSLSRGLRPRVSDRDTQFTPVKSRAAEWSPGTGYVISVANSSTMGMSGPVKIPNTIQVN
jgi:hypothetical protein